MFGAQEDLWSIHCTFGKVIPGTPRSGKIPEHIKKTHMLKDVRVFDIKILLDMVRSNAGGMYDKSIWAEFGINTECRALWKLAAELIGAELDEFDWRLHPSQQATFWNRRGVTDSMKIYAALDAATSVHCFMAVFRLKLFPHAVN